MIFKKKTDILVVTLIPFTSDLPPRKQTKHFNTDYKY